MNSFVTPVRKILKHPDVANWEKSQVVGYRKTGGECSAAQAYADYMGLLESLNEATKRRSLSDGAAAARSAAVDALLGLLDRLDGFVDECPPSEQPQRFGNRAFRAWHKRLVDSSPDLIASIVPAEKLAAQVELAPYLADAFGNPTRIDYGTGHEANFLIFLCCLYKLGVLQAADSLAVVNLVFHRYLELVRRLQLTYKMEPAGSQGVWALDDHQFVPFIWGSAQLIDHPSLDPSSFTKDNLLEQYANEFLFMEAIKFINQVKSGPFAEHSNQLWNVSAVPTWSKVNSGLFKMYKAEVLAKFPVVQHLVFGSLMSYEPAKELP